MDGQTKLLQRGIVGAMVVSIEIIPWWKSHLGQLIITLHRHSTSYQRGGKHYKTIIMSVPSSLSPCSLSRLKFAEMQIILSISSSAHNPISYTAHNPASKPCSFAEIEGCDPGCPSHHILPPLTVGIGLTSQIRCWGWDDDGREKQRDPYLWLAEYFWWNKKKKTTFWQLLEQTSKLQHFSLTKNPYMVHPLIVKMKLNLTLIY